MDIVSVYPNSTTKILAKEPLTIYVTVQSDSKDHQDFINNLKLELWGDIYCEEFEQYGSLDEYAAKLRYYKREGNLYFFKRTLNPIRAGFFSFSIRYMRDGETLWKWYDNKKIIPIQVEPSWSANTIIYNAFVRQFGAKDDDGDGIIRPGEGGTFDDLIRRMDYFKQMGIGAIYLNPIQISGEIFRYEEDGIKFYENNLTNHLPVHMHPGSVYSIKEYKSIDPELGLNPRDTETDQYQEFKRFCGECHKNGIRVILDVVFDHTSRDSFLQRLHPEWFLYSTKPKELGGEWITQDHPEAEKYWGKPEYAKSPFDHGIFWGDCIQLNWNYYYAYETWMDGYDKRQHRPPLNTTLDKMKEYFKSVLRYWIKNYGVDGFRLDVSYAVPPEFWHEALQDCRNYARSVKGELKPLTPDIVFIGETYVDRVYDLQECGITALNGDFSSKIFNVEMLKGYIDYVNNISGDFFPRGSRWVQFPECHDFHRLPKKFEGELHHDYSDVQLNKSRWVLASLLPGIPMLHNGYEVVEHENVSVQTYTGINWKSSKNISAYISKINKIRNTHIAFQKGTYHFVDSEQGVTSQSQLYSFLRDYKQGSVRQTCLVVVNMDINNKANHVTINIPDIEGYDFEKTYVLRDLVTGEMFEREGRFVTILLDPGESHVFEVLQ